MPRQFALQKVEEDVPQRLQVIATTLLHSQMIAQRGITRSSRQTLILSVPTLDSRKDTPLDVRLRQRIPVTLAQTQVDDVDEIRLLPQTDHEVVRFYVSVNE